MHKEDRLLLIDTKVAKLLAFMKVIIVYLDRLLEKSLVYT